MVSDAALQRGLFLVEGDGRLARPHPRRREGAHLLNLPVQHELELHVWQRRRLRMGSVGGRTTVLPASVASETLKKARTRLGLEELQGSGFKHRLRARNTHRASCCGVVLGALGQPSAAPSSEMVIRNGTTAS